MDMVVSITILTTVLIFLLLILLALQLQITQITRETADIHSKLKIIAEKLGMRADVD